nr:MAG TPA: hypothetical protein [Caudoviricetes sp.]
MSMVVAVDRYRYVLICGAYQIKYKLARLNFR